MACSSLDAHFAFDPMFHVIDLIGSIRLRKVKGDKEHYVPLLVSISTKHHKESQKAQLNNIGGNVVGCEDVWFVYSTFVCPSWSTKNSRYGNHFEKGRCGQSPSWRSRIGGSDCARR